MEEKRKMSNSNHTRGFLPLGQSRKRESGPKAGSDGFKRPPKLIRPTSNPSPYLHPIPTPTPKPVTQKLGNKSELKASGYKAGGNNRVLAGYMATEFFEKGTILGQKYDPARSETSPVSSSSKGKEGGGSSNKQQPIVMSERYAEVANLMKNDGTRIPGIVNPTQLARWLQM